MDIIYFDMALSFYALVLICNTIVSLIYLIPAYINLRNYTRLKLLDNLVISIYFIFWSSQIFAIALALFLGNNFLYLLSTLLLGVHLTALFTIAVRFNWTNPPKWVYPIFLLYLYQMVIPLFSISTDWWRVEDILLIPGFDPLTLLLVLVGIIRSKTALNITRIKQTKKLWIIGILFHLSPQILHLITLDILGLAIAMGPVFLLLAILLLQYIGVLFISGLHIFYPEAILITDEQLHRARKLFKKVKHRQKETRDVKIGPDAVLNYINSLPSQIKEQQLQQSDNQSAPIPNWLVQTT